MAPTKKAPKGQSTAGVVKIGIEVTPEVYARLQRGAKADERTVSAYVRRFVTGNLDLLDADGAEASE